MEVLASVVVILFALWLEMCAVVCPHGRKSRSTRPPRSETEVLASHISIQLS